MLNSFIVVLMCGTVYAYTCVLVQEWREQRDAARKIKKVNVHVHCSGTVYAFAYLILVPKSLTAPLRKCTWFLACSRLPIDFYG